MHKLLLRQLKRFLGENHRNVPSKEWQALLEGVSRSYEEFDTDHELIERSLDIASREQAEIKQKLEEKIQEDAEQNIQLENAVREMEKFKQAVESATDAICITDDNGHISYANAKWEAMTGYKKNELRGRTIMAIQFDENDIHTMRELYTALETGNEFSSESLVSGHKNGETRNVEVIIYPVKEDNKVLFFVWLVEDITERKKKEVAKSEFVSLVSHQLRSPLTVMRWGLERMLATDTLMADKDTSDQLHESYEAVINMIETVNTMLMVSRYEERHLTSHTTVCDLNVVLATIQETYRMTMERRNQEFSITCPTNCRIETDCNLLGEILGNLVSNAVKYTPDGGEITVICTVNDDILTIEVQDSGVGIPRREQSRIFEKFFRASNVLKQNADGTGLGLYMVHSLISMINGSISFVSEPDQGSTFTISLPIKPDHVE